MKAAVVTFPGSNCDDDCFYALKKAGFSAEFIWHDEKGDLGGPDLVVLPGGFSYGDYLRCGAMAALSPAMGAVSSFAKQGGLVLGMCNGFQILCEVGLLPGALARNLNLSFLCREVSLRVESTQSPWTGSCKIGELLLLPIAHGDGRYIITDSEYQSMQERGQILLTYLDNPNGSSFSIGGVCNQGKNVFGLMPHLERATDLGSLDGMKIWSSVLQFFAGRTT